MYVSYLLDQDAACAMFPGFGEPGGGAAGGGGAAYPAGGPADPVWPPPGPHLREDWTPGVPYGPPLPPPPPPHPPPPHLHPPHLLHHHHHHPPPPPPPPPAAAASGQPPGLLNPQIVGDGGAAGAPRRTGIAEWMRREQPPPPPPPPPTALGGQGRTRTKDKYRVVYSDLQRLELEAEFRVSRYVTARRKAELAAALGLSERQVKIWFQNRRAKERKINKKKLQPPPPPAQLEPGGSGVLGPLPGGVP